MSTDALLHWLCSTFPRYACSEAWAANAGLFAFLLVAMLWGASDLWGRWRGRRE